MIGPDKTIGIYVADQPQAVAFYTEELGFEVHPNIPSCPARTGWRSPRRAPRAASSYPKTLMSNWAELKPSMVLHCPNVEKTCRRLSVQGRADHNAAAAVAVGDIRVVLDRDGNEIRLKSQELA